MKRLQMAAALVAMSVLVGLIHSRPGGTADTASAGFLLTEAAGQPLSAGAVSSAARFPEYEPETGISFLVRANDHNMFKLGFHAGAYAGTENSPWKAQGPPGYGTNCEYSAFVGLYAGEFATQTEKCAAFGAEAGQHATNVCNSAIFGSSAAHEAWFAPNSCFVGHSAGRYANWAPFAVGVGCDATRYTSNAEYSVTVGSFAGRNELSGGWRSVPFSIAYSTILGSYAGLESQSPSNVFVGFSAGRYATNTTGSILIGNWSAATNLTNVIVIGATAGAVRNNQTVIGNDWTTQTVLRGKVTGDGSGLTNLPAATSCRLITGSVYAPVGTLARVASLNGLTFSTSGLGLVGTPMVRGGTLKNFAFKLGGLPVGLMPTTNVTVSVLYGTTVNSAGTDTGVGCVLPGDGQPSAVTNDVTHTFTVPDGSFLGVRWEGSNPDDTGNLCIVWSMELWSDNGNSQ